MDWNGKCDNIFARFIRERRSDAIKTFGRKLIDNRITRDTLNSGFFSIDEWRSAECIRTLGTLRYAAGEDPIEIYIPCNWIHERGTC
jgi:hypothetical protein